MKDDGDNNDGNGDDEGVNRDHCIMVGYSNFRWRSISDVGDDVSDVFCDNVCDVVGDIDWCWCLTTMRCIDYNYCL